MTEMPEATVMQPAKNHSRHAWLDGVRGLAIFGVVMVHAAQIAPAGSWPNRVFGFGQYGVQLFFMVSTLTCILTLQRGPRITDWYIRRASRIAIVYWCGLVFYFPVFMLQAKMGMKDLSFADPLNILANLLFLHGWVPSANNSVVPGGWSIAVEMNFYLIAPLVVPLLARPGRAALILTGLSVAFLALNQTLNGPVANNRFTYFWPVNQIPVFLLVIAAYALVLRAGRDIWNVAPPPSVTDAGRGSLRNRGGLARSPRKHQPRARPLTHRARRFHRRGRLGNLALDRRSALAGIPGANQLQPLHHPFCLRRYRSVHCSTFAACGIHRSMADLAAGCGRGIRTIGLCGHLAAPPRRGTLSPLGRLVDPGHTPPERISLGLNQPCIT